MNEGGWIGIASIAITGAFALANRIVSNRHDDKLKALATQNATQATQIVALEASTQACTDEHAATKVALETARRELAERDERDKAALTDRLNAQQTEINNLKTRLGSTD